MTLTMKERLLELVRQTKAEIEKIGVSGLQAANIAMLNKTINQLETEISEISREDAI